MRSAPPDGASDVTIDKDYVFEGPDGKETWPIFSTAAVS